MFAFDIETVSPLTRWARTIAITSPTGRLPSRTDAFTDWMAAANRARREGRVVLLGDIFDHQPAAFHKVDFVEVERRLMAFYTEVPKIECKLCAMGIPTGQQPAPMEA